MIKINDALERPISKPPATPHNAVVSVVRMFGGEVPLGGVETGMGSGDCGIDVDDNGECLGCIFGYCSNTVLSFSIKANAIDEAGGDRWWR